MSLMWMPMWDGKGRKTKKSEAARLAALAAAEAERAKQPPPPPPVVTAAPTADRPWGRDISCLGQPDAPLFPSVFDGSCCRAREKAPRDLRTAHIPAPGQVPARGADGLKWGEQAAAPAAPVTLSWLPLPDQKKERVVVEGLDADGAVAAAATVAAKAAARAAKEAERAAAAKERKEKAAAAKEEKAAAAAAAAAAKEAERRSKAAAGKGGRGGLEAEVIRAEGDGLWRMVTDLFAPEAPTPPVTVRAHSRHSGAGAVSTVKRQRSPNGSPDRQRAAPKAGGRGKGGRGNRGLRQGVMSSSVTGGHHEQMVEPEHVDEPESEPAFTPFDYDAMGLDTADDASLPQGITTDPNLLRLPSLASLPLDNIGALCPLPASADAVTDAACKGFPGMPPEFDLPEDFGCLEGLGSPGGLSPGGLMNIGEHHLERGASSPPPLACQDSLDLKLTEGVGVIEISV